MTIQQMTRQRSNLLTALRAGLILWTALAASGPAWTQVSKEAHEVQTETTQANAAPTAAAPTAIPIGTVKHLGSFEVIELRRYTIQPGGREDFALYFESYFPEAFEQLGAIAFGHFFERARPDHFTWLRGFHDIDARARVNAEFYYGPLWKEHRETLNSLIVDSDDVLLLHPVSADRGVPVLPAVDVVREKAGAQGIVALQIFAVPVGGVDAFLRSAEPAFAGYRAAGARDAGVLATLDVKNNFPQLPVRSDGPYVVWLGIVPDEAALARLAALARAFAESPEARSSARAATEWVVLDPARRSRLRWLAAPHRQ